MESSSHPQEKKSIEKEGSCIKQVSKRELQVLIDGGYVNGSTLKGVAVTSRGKKSRGKHYYVKDWLAFTAWQMLGLEPDNKDYQRWKKRQLQRKE